MAAKCQRHGNLSNLKIKRMKKKQIKDESTSRK